MTLSEYIQLDLFPLLIDISGFCWCLQKPSNILPLEYFFISALNHLTIQRIFWLFLGGFLGYFLSFNFTFKCCINNIGNFRELFSNLCPSVQYEVQMAKALVYFQNFFSYVIWYSFLHQARDQLVAVTLSPQNIGARRGTREAKYL